jgi:alkylated DNA repair dioxygenase AlkB
MYDLFNPPPENKNPFNQSHENAIQGLRYVPAFITKDGERDCLYEINSMPWLSDIKRRVQHYGYKYDYKSRAIDYSMYLGELPIWAKRFAKRLYQEGLVDEEPDQMIVNEYHPGQGIANHVDCEPCFGETIASISLGAYCVMDFINLETRQKVEILMEPCSVVVIRGEARHLWTHGIAQRKTDFIDGLRIDRKLRVSMTFRKVLLPSGS